jgi:hypothetical protein
LIKPSKSHGKNNTIPKEVTSFLEILELYSEVYSEVERIKLATSMLHGKAQMWQGQFKVDWEVHTQP